MPHDPTGKPALPGRYLPGGSAPGSASDLAGRMTAGWPATVLRLRFAGVYLPITLLNERPRHSGLVLTTNSYGDDDVSFVSASDVRRTMLPDLGRARMVKAREDGALLIEGIEWDEGQLRRWSQTWLCCPDAAGIDTALQLMCGWLDRQYAAAKAVIERQSRR